MRLYAVRTFLAYLVMSAAGLMGGGPRGGHVPACGPVEAGATPDQCAPRERDRARWYAHDGRRLAHAWQAARGEQAGEQAVQPGI